MDELDQRHRVGGGRVGWSCPRLLSSGQLSSGQEENTNTYFLLLLVVMMLNDINNFSPFFFLAY